MSTTGKPSEPKGMSAACGKLKTVWKAGPSPKVVSLADQMEKEETESGEAFRQGAPQEIRAEKEVNSVTKPKNDGDSSKKVFVGGLSNDITAESLKAFFKQFGAVQKTKVVRCQATGISRGYGFVEFEEEASAQKVIGRSLDMDGKMVDCNSATFSDSQNPGNATMIKKLFIGGLSQRTTSEVLEEHFGKYGDIIKAVVMMDSRILRSRGFGFVTFSDHSAIEKALREEHELDGKIVECRQALPRYCLKNEKSRQQKQNGKGKDKQRRNTGNNTQLTIQVPPRAQTSQSEVIPPPGYHQPLYAPQHAGAYPPDGFQFQPHLHTRVHPPPHHGSLNHPLPQPQNNYQNPVPPPSNQTKKSKAETPKHKSTISKTSSPNPNLFRSPMRTMHPSNQRFNQHIPNSPGSPFVPCVSYLPSHLLSPEGAGQSANFMHPPNHFPLPHMQPSVQLGYGASGLYGYFLSPSPQRNPMYSPTFERHGFSKPRMPSLASPPVNRTQPRRKANKKPSPTGPPSGKTQPKLNENFRTPKHSGGIAAKEVSTKAIMAG